MNSKWLVGLLEAAALAATLAAVFQELEKPPRERKWHGTVAGFVPYDFRPPTAQRLKEAIWNPYESRAISPTAFGIGWTVNFYRLLENLHIIHYGCGSEEDFLMPGKHMREVLTGGKQ